MIHDAGVHDQFNMAWTATEAAGISAERALLEGRLDGAAFAARFAIARPAIFRFCGVSVAKTLSR